MLIRITADSACDLSPALREQYNIGIISLPVTVGDRTGLDGIDILPDDLYRYVEESGSLPSTAAVNPMQYTEFFQQQLEDCDAVIHISLGSKISSSHQNARLAAAEFSTVSVVDSDNLSTGYGHVVLYAAELAQCGDLTPEEIVDKVRTIIPKVSAGFVLGRLDYMKKGGRCSTVAALGANLLKLKPSIAVKDGTMGVVKKYRGSLEKCLKDYVADQLNGREDLVLDRIFITHSGVSPETVEMVRQEIQKYANFKEITETRAGCTISAHCGPDCLGILFVTK